MKCTKLGQLVIALKKTWIQKIIHNLVIKKKKTPRTFLRKQLIKKLGETWYLRNKMHNGQNNGKNQETEQIISNIDCDSEDQL